MKFLEALVITIVIVTICYILYSVIDSLIVPGARLSSLKTNNNTLSNVQKSNIQKSNVQKSRFSQNINLIPNKRATRHHTTATSIDYDFMLVGEGKMIDDTRPPEVATTELLSETAGETIGFGDEQDYEASPSEQIQSDDIDDIDEVDENNESGNQVTSSGDVDAQLGYAFFGAHTIGGGTGVFKPVTNVGQLMAALESNEPRIEIASGTYTFMSDSGREYVALKVKSNTTIIGENGGTGVFINGGFSIVGEKNVIIRNLTFLTFLDFFNTQTNDVNLYPSCKSYEKAGKDAIDLCSVDNINIDESSYVWINKCTFEKTGDGLIDIKGGSKNVTVSWCRLSYESKDFNPSQFLSGTKEGAAAWEERHNKTMLIGSDDHVGKPDKVRADKAITVTLHNNLFAGKSRNPRLRFGTVHTFNNYYFTCGVDDGYGIYAAMDSTVLAEGNYFEKVGDAAQTDSGQIFGRYLEVTSDVNSQVNDNKVNILDECKGRMEFKDSSDTEKYAPYNYELMNPIEVKTKVLKNAGSGSRAMSYEPPGAPVGSIQNCKGDRFGDFTSCTDIKRKNKDKIEEGRYIKNTEDKYYQCVDDGATGPKPFKDAAQPCKPWGL